jgi:hypothetical protein
VSGQFTSPISRDGRYVVFSSSASNLVPGDTNNAVDVFIRDRLLGTTALLSVSSSGTPGNLPSQAGGISADGRYVVFPSDANNLVVTDTNQQMDVFLRDRGTVDSTPFCFGDGTGAACPCGNMGSSDSGCANSIVAAGGRLLGAGQASVALDGFFLTGTGMPNSAALYFQGTTQVAGGLGAPFGDGLRCAGGTVIRLVTRINTANGSSYPDVLDPPISIRGAIPAGGGTRTYQVWYRNQSGPCGSGHNLTNGVLVAWRP